MSKITLFFTKNLSELFVCGIFEKWSGSEIVILDEIGITYRKSSYVNLIYYSVEYGITTERYLSQKNNSSLDRFFLRCTRVDNLRKNLRRGTTAWALWVIPWLSQVQRPMSPRWASPPRRAVQQSHTRGHVWWAALVVGNVPESTTRALTPLLTAGVYLPCCNAPWRRRRRLYEKKIEWKRWRAN